MGCVQIRRAPHQPSRPDALLAAESVCGGLCWGFGGVTVRPAGHLLPGCPNALLAFKCVSGVLCWGLGGL